MISRSILTLLMFGAGLCASPVAVRAQTPQALETPSPAPTSPVSPAPVPTALPSSLPGSPLPNASATVPPAPASVGPEWSAFSDYAAKFNDITFSIVNHEEKGKIVADQTYRIVYRKPMMARCEITAGPGRGAVAVWTGGERVKAHMGGILAGAVAIVRRNDPRATDTLGYGCGETTPDQIATYWSTHGTLTETVGPTIGDVATGLVTWVPEPNYPIDIDREELFISKATHLPIESTGYKAGKIVEHSTYVDVRTDTGVPDAAFNVRRRYP